MDEAAYGFGHVEPGERVEAALVREIAEELGTDARIAGFMGVVEHGYLEDGIKHHELNLVFEVRLLEVMTVPLPDADGSLEAAGAEVVLERAKRSDVLVLGPGVGRQEGAAALAIATVNS